MREAGFDQNLTVFSPEGRLYQVEYAFQAMRTPGLSYAAVRCRDGVVLVSQLPSSDRLVDSTSNSFIHKINDYCVAMVCGRVADGRKIIDKLRSESAEFLRKWGYQPPAAEACERLADINQVYTQEAWQRPYGVICMVAGWDYQGRRSSLYKTDPAGTCMGWRAAAAGAKENELGEWLIQQLHPGESEEPTVEEGTKVCLRGFQKYVSGSLTGDDVEVVIIREGTQEGGDRVSRLKVEEVDDILGRLPLED